MNAAKGIITFILLFISVELFHAQSFNWENASPESQGLNSKIIAQADSFLSSYNKQNPLTHSILIIRNGKIVHEKYYNRFLKNRLNNLKSVTKSVVSILIGIAIDKKLIIDENQKLSDLMPELFDDKLDPDKKEITLKQILTMSAGFEWNNLGGRYRSGWDKSKNPSEYLIHTVRLKSKPGKKWNYNSALSHLLSAIINKYSGSSTLEFAKRYLFDPLGIKNIRWQKSKDGNEMGNSELHLTPRDLAKIGLLMLNEGQWEGKQIVSKEWINKSIKKYFDGFPQIGGYGYQWHTRKFGEYESYLAAGWGGQFLIVIPGLQMIVVNTSKWNVSKSTYKIFDVIDKYIVEAVN